MNKKFVFVFNLFLVLVLSGCVLARVVSAGASPEGATYSCCYGGGFCASYSSREACLDHEDEGCQWNPLCDPASALGELVRLVVIFISWTPFFGIVAGSVFLLIGGFRYLTAGDDVDEAEKARHTVVFAVVGIVLSSAVWLFARVVTLIIPGLGQYIGTT